MSSIACYGWEGTLTAAFAELAATVMRRRVLKICMLNSWFGNECVGVVEGANVIVSCSFLHDANQSFIATPLRSERPHIVNQISCKFGKSSQSPERSVCDMKAKPIEPHSASRSCTWNPRGTRKYHAWPYPMMCIQLILGNFYESGVVRPV